MNRILIDTAALHSLLAAHPEVEIDITAVAAEKIAEEFRRKVGPDYVSRQVDAAVKQITDQVHKGFTRYSIPNEISDKISQAVAEHIQRGADLLAREAMVKLESNFKLHVEERLKTYQEGLFKRIDEYVGATVSKQVAAALAGITKLASEVSKS
ncbi:hypothetical protein [Telmatospirillum sp.]|uniref:hypothetical protein n=1 Tax=Telmatospirillum sp. TaxID=2079197 RepID=UPI00284058EA|nr:hypothetical protein [Telmatospirillum sp.]MDR3436405.1 hypothetical protein [Telmatospirillum sp.]